MTIEEARTHLRALEQSFLQGIHQFEDATGLRAESVDLVRVQGIGETSRRTIAVYVTAHLPR